MIFSFRLACQAYGHDRIFKDNIEPLLPYLCRKLLGLDLSRYDFVNCSRL